jgi:imidazolonepropionase-like amidohydrolase
MVLFGNGKIIDVRKTAPIADIQVIDLKGKHVYPGLICAATNLGLTEVSSVKATADHTEVGEVNPSIRALISYNTDSKVINTLRSNGVLLANIVPQGGVITGTSSVVQLDAWNWEDAVYLADGGMHMNVPVMVPRPSFRRTAAPQPDASQSALQQLAEIKAYFLEAKSYYNQKTPAATNLNFEAMRGLFSKKQKLYMHCNGVKEIMLAVDFAKELGLNAVIVGGNDAWMVADLLKQNNIPVILNNPHSLPSMQDDDVDQPFKTAVQLHKAGVLVSLFMGDSDGFTQARNLPFEAGTTVAYGLSKEEALQLITRNAAKILGIDGSTGTLESGKDANLVVSEGDILDVKSSNITHAYIQGRAVSLDDKHKQLFERYKHKYEIK